MSETNIEDLSSKKGPVPKWLEKDNLTMAESLLGMGNTDAAKECYIAAGMDSKQAEKMVEEWLNRGKETTH
jgi:hypothetical protein